MRQKLVTGDGQHQLPSTPHEQSQAVLVLEPSDEL